MFRLQSASSALAPAFAILLSAAGFAQTTWHVDASAVPPGNGTPGSPYASIQYAIDQPSTVAGDTVLVAPGTYFEALVVNKFITLRSSGGPLATIIRATSSGDGVAVGATGGPVFEGFTVIANCVAAGVYLGGGTMRRCIVRDCTAVSGVEVGFGSIESSTIVRNRMGVIGQAFTGSIYIHNTIVWGNEFTNVNPGGSALSGTFNAGFGGVINDPGLWDPDAADAHLRPGSPCIDRGDPSSPPDPDGSRIDIGAVVYDPTYAPGPSTYCVGKLNSQGCTPSIGFAGSASATSSGPFAISASNLVDNKPGLLLVGLGKVAVPFQGGTLCVQAPVKRVGPQLSGGAGPCTGTFAFDMQAYIQSGAHPALVPGTICTAQWWGRDPLEPAGFGSSLSDALYFGVAP